MTTSPTMRRSRACLRIAFLTRPPPSGRGSAGRCSCGGRASSLARRADVEDGAPVAAFAGAVDGRRARRLGRVGRDDRRRRPGRCRPRRAGLGAVEVGQLLVLAGRPCGCTAGACPGRRAACPAARRRVGRTALPPLAPPSCPVEIVCVAAAGLEAHVRGRCRRSSGPRRRGRPSSTRTPCSSRSSEVNGPSWILMSPVGRIDLRHALGDQVGLRQQRRASRR